MYSEQTLFTIYFGDWVVSFVLSQDQRTPTFLTALAIINVIFCISFLLINVLFKM